MDRMRGDSIYDRTAGKGELSSYQFSELTIDYTQSALFNITPGLTGSLTMGVTYEAHGEWLHVDTSSVGAPLATLYADGEDSRAIALLPGITIRAPFDRIRVFGNLVSNFSSLTSGTGSVDPVTRILYGVGDCPFDGQPIIGGTSAPIYNSGVFNGAGFVGTAAQYTSSNLFVPQAALATVGVYATQVTGAAETSLLRPFLDVFDESGNGATLLPDFIWTIDVATAGAGTARMGAKFFPFRVPKNGVRLNLRVTNFGNAATNPVTLVNGQLEVQ